MADRSLLSSSGPSGILRIQPLPFSYELPWRLRHRNPGEIGQRENAMDTEQDRLAFMLEHVPDATVVVDSSGSIVFANSLAQKLFGYDQDELIGQSIEMLVPLRLRSTHAIQRSCYSSNPHVRSMGMELDIYARRKDGSEFPADASLIPVQTEKGILIVSAIRDISVRKHLAEEQRLYAERLQHLHELYQAIQAIQPPEVTSATALSRIVELVPCRWGSIAVYNPGAPASTVLATYVDGQIRAGQGQQIVPNSSMQAGRFEQDRLHTVNDHPRDAPVPASLAILRPVGLCSYLQFDLWIQNQLIGVLALGADRPGVFTAEHGIIAREMGNQLTVAIQNARLFQEVQQAEVRLRRLSQRLMEVQEVERQHISRELHDQFGQALTALKINLQTLQRPQGAPQFASLLQDSINISERIIQQSRDLARHLRPPVLDDLGLVRALRWYVDREAQRTGIEVQFIANLARIQLPAEIETACFRVAQEALTNVARHAQAHHVWVELRERPSELVLTIRDDGVGFDVQTIQDDAEHEVSLGILGMRERVELLGGQLTIESTPSHGTVVQARIPLRARPR